MRDHQRELEMSFMPGMAETFAAIQPCSSAVSHRSEERGPVLPFLPLTIPKRVVDSLGLSSIHFYRARCLMETVGL